MFGTIPQECFYSCSRQGPKGRLADCRCSSETRTHYIARLSPPLRSFFGKEFFVRVLLYCDCIVLVSVICHLIVLDAEYNFGVCMAFIYGKRESGGVAQLGVQVRESWSCGTWQEARAPDATNEAVYRKSGTPTLICPHTGRFQRNRSGLSFSLVIKFSYRSPSPVGSPDIFLLGNTVHPTRLRL